MSFEFTKEFLKDAKSCARYISKLGNASFNFSLYSEFELNSKVWLDSKRLFEELEEIDDDYLCGDIYVKLD